MRNSLYIHDMFAYSLRHRKEVQMDLIEARKKERYTQQQAADYLGVSRATYAKMEKNPGNITLDDARKLADLYKVDVRDIFFPINNS